MPAFLRFRGKMAPRKSSSRKKPSRPGTQSNGIVLDQARHYMRAIRVEEGEKAADVARSEGVTIRAIDKSIQLVKNQRGVYTQQNMNTAMVGMLLNTLAKVAEALERGLNAEQYLERKSADGSIDYMPVPDKTAQLEAMRVFGSYFASMQAKGGGISVKVQQNNANQASAVATGRGGYEEMLHQVIKEANTHNLLPAATADVIDDEDYSEEDDDDETMTA